MYQIILKVIKQIKKLIFMDEKLEMYKKLLEEWDFVFIYQILKMIQKDGQYKNVKITMDGIMMVNDLGEKCINGKMKV